MNDKTRNLFIAKIFISIKMRLFNLAIIIIILIIPSIHAWSWDSYEGKTTWDVKVTVDEKGCGGTVYSNSRSLTITHKKSAADLTDVGHGPVSGTFSGNILTIPARTIPDGSGKSDLGMATVMFTTDCTIFTTKYPWHYHDQYQDCSGTTSWDGKRTDSKECPAVTEEKTEQPEAKPTVSTEKQVLTVPQISYLPISEQKEEYTKYLQKDPGDFVANYELAQILKEEKEYKEFIKHIDKALENKNEATNLKQEREKEVTQRLQLTIRPNGVTVPLLRSVEDELDTVPNPMIYDFNVLKEPDKRTWRQKMTEYLSKPFKDVVRN